MHLPPEAERLSPITLMHFSSLLLVVSLTALEARNKPESSKLSIPALRMKPLILNSETHRGEQFAVKSKAKKNR